MDAYSQGESGRRGDSPIWSRMTQVDIRPDAGWRCSPIANTGHYCSLSNNPPSEDLNYIEAVELSISPLPLKYAALLDGRINFFYQATGVSPAMAAAPVGAGSQYAAA